MGSGHWCSPPPPSASLRRSHPNSCRYLPVILQDLSRSHQRSKPPDRLKSGNDPPAASHVTAPPPGAWEVGSALCARPCPPPPARVAEEAAPGLVPGELPPLVVLTLSSSHVL